MSLSVHANFNDINSLQNEIQSCQYYTIRDFLSSFSTYDNNTNNFRDNENSNFTVPAINNVNNSNTNDNNSEDNNSNNSDKNTLYNKDSITDINDHLSLLHINSRSIKF